MIVIEYHTGAAGERLYDMRCEHGTSHYDVSLEALNASSAPALLDEAERQHIAAIGCQCKRKREKQRMATMGESLVDHEPGLPPYPDPNRGAQPQPRPAARDKRATDLLKYLEDVTRRLPPLYDEVDDAERAFALAKDAAVAKQQEILQSPVVGMMTPQEREQHVYDALLDERMAIARANDVLRSANKRLAVAQEMAANLRAQASLLALPGVW